MQPKARHRNVIVREIAGEFVLYDEKTQRAHELNAAAASVWRHCDAKTSIGDLAAALAIETALPADEEVVHLALDQLSKAGLLEGPHEAFEARMSRRQIVHRLGLAGSLAFLLPVVSTLVAPSPAMAQSVPPPG